MPNKKNALGSDAERNEKILNETMKYLNLGKHVIVIDDQLKTEDSFLQNKLSDYQTFVFIDFS